MPLPTPKDEEKQEFIERCMSDEKMKEEFPENKQRYAVCMKQFEKNEEEKMDIIEKIDKYLDEGKLSINSWFGQIADLYKKKTGKDISKSETIKDPKKNKDYWKKGKELQKKGKTPEEAFKILFKDI